MADQTLLDRHPALQAVLEKKPGSSATEVANSLGVTPAAMSSLLKKMTTEGSVTRSKGKGPRGGYGYTIVARPPDPSVRTAWQRLLEDG